jgi:hypothetical protein
MNIIMKTHVLYKKIIKNNQSGIEIFKKIMLGLNK